MSWLGVYFTIGEASGNGDLAYIGTFQSNFDRADAVTNRIEQFSVCLYPEVRYVAKLVNIESSDQPTTNLNLIRVASPMCNIFLSGDQLSQNLIIDKWKVCNPCAEGNTLLEVLMLSNVTDDDVDDYTWRGMAGYKIYNSVNPSSYLYAGQLLVSDEEADRYCLPNGEYTIELHDDELWANRHKHASIVVTYGDAVMQGVMPDGVMGEKITLMGTSRARITVGKSQGIFSRDNIIDGAIIIIAVLSIMWCMIVHFKSVYPATTVDGAVDEGMPLVARRDPEAQQ